MENMDGIDVSALGSDYRTRDREKGRLLLEARVLWERGEIDRATDLYAELAAIEEQLMWECSSLGVPKKSWIHGVSAANCWIKAGDFHRARRLCFAMLEQTELPATLRQSVESLADGLRDGRRLFWEAVQQKAAA